MTPQFQIHHIVDGQSVCGKGGGGYTDVQKVLSSTNKCPDCLKGMDNSLLARINDLASLVTEFKEIVFYSTGYRRRRKLLSINKKMEESISSIKLQYEHYTHG